MGRVIKFFLQYIVVLVLIIGFGFWIRGKTKHPMQESDNSKSYNQIFDDAFNLDNLEEEMERGSNIKVKVIIENEDNIKQDYNNSHAINEFLYQRIKEEEKIKSEVKKTVKEKYSRGLYSIMPNLQDTEAP